MVNRRQLLKAGLFAALVPVLAPVVKLLPRWPWGPWTRMFYFDGSLLGVMRQRHDLDRMTLDIEIIVRPRKVVDKIDVQIVIADSGVDFGDIVA